MKNLKICTLMLISLLIVSMTACKGSSNGTYIGSDKQPLNITIAANESITFAKTQRSSRTIVAEPFEADNTLTFYLWGKAQSGQTLNPKTVTVTSADGITGKVILDIDCYNWSLTLAACETADLPGSNPSEADVLAKAVLVGYGNVDMMFTNDIKFTLTPKGLSKVGDVDLTLQLESGTVIPDGYVATAYIYDITTGDEIKSSDTTPASISTVLDIDELEGTGASYTANDKTIRPGTYRFQVEFVKPTGNEKRKYVWNDTIIILPGKTVTQTITIPNLVGTKPVAPSAFTVQFNKKQDGENVVDEAEEASYPGFYVAHFTWDGSAVNTEMNYAMEIAEVADGYTIPDTFIVDDESGTAEANATAKAQNKTNFEAIFGTDPAAAPVLANANAKYSFNYLKDIRADTRFYKGGSLFANSEYVDVYLELGKRYIARLYSENNAGYSTDAAYLTITPVETGAAMKTINRYRVKYVVQGGVWNDGTTNKDAEPAANKKDKIVYWSQSDASHKYTVLNPVQDASTHLGTSAEQPYLYNGPADWIYWIQELATGTKYPDAASNPYAPNPYAGFKNLTLYAAYSREGDIEIYDDITYDILQAWVDAFNIYDNNGSTDDASDDTFVSRTSTNTVSKSTDLSNAANATVTVTVPSSVGWKYDKVALSITYAGRTYFDEEQVGAAGDSANTFTIALSNLPTGYVYNCLISAQYQMTTVSYPFTVYLTD